MSVQPFLADPGFPRLDVAGDPEVMREVFRTHLRPLTGKAYDIRDCRLSRIRYRRASRCFLQYALGLVEPSTGHQQDLRVTGLVYAEENKAERIWQKLQATDPQREIPETLLTFEPVSYIPDLGMLVQVFPYDRRLPALPLLAAEPPPELEPLLLARFGEGDWRAGAYTVDPARYREQLEATLRYTVRAREADTGKTDERRFYVKIYRGEKGERTHLALRSLGKMSETEGGFAVVRPVAYLSGLRALVLEEVPGTSLEQILLQGHDTVEAARRIARALATFNQVDVGGVRRHLRADRVATLERTGRLLKWACPHLRTKVETIIDATVSGLEEVPLGPTHRDLKPEHIILDGDRTTFIDLDSFASADPVLDPALLLARLVALPDRSRVPRSRTRTAARAFAEEYFTHVPEAWRNRLPLHYAGAMLEVAYGFFRSQQQDWITKMAALVEEAEDSLAGYGDGVLGV